MSEIWKPSRICDFLEVSNLGRIRTKDRIVKSKNRSPQFIKGKIKKPSTHKNGYQSICVSVKNKSIRYLVHRLVANEFCADVKNKTVNHKDFNKKNNIASNLEVVSLKENNHHFQKSEKGKIVNKLRGLLMRGENNKSSKVTNKQAKEILDLYLDGKTQKQIAKIYKISKSTVGNIVNKKTYHLK